MLNPTASLLATLALLSSNAAQADDLKAALSPEEMSKLMHTWSDGERLSIVPFAGIA